MNWTRSQKSMMSLVHLVRRHSPSSNSKCDVPWRLLCTHCGPQPFYSRPGMVPRAFHDPMAFSGSPTVRGEPAMSLGGSGSHTLLESQKALPVSQAWYWVSSPEHLYGTWVCLGEREWLLVRKAVRDDFLRLPISSQRATMMPSPCSPIGVLI